MIPLANEIEEIKERLTSIFNHYSNKFELNIKLIFIDKKNNCDYFHNSRIEFGIEYILKTFGNGEMKRRHSYNNLVEYAIIVLLHELKHAIDFRYDYEKYMQKHWEQKEKCWGQVFVSPLEYAKFPLEKEADNFAHYEIEKWRLK